MATIAVDANVLVGLVDDGDKWHAAARALTDALAETEADLVTFDCVINEAISVLSRRTREQGREDRLHAVLDHLVDLIPAHEITWASRETEHLYHEIIALVRGSHGELNFHDALIALVSRDLDVPALVSFDRDFDAVPWITRISRTAHVHEMVECD